MKITKKLISLALAAMLLLGLAVPAMAADEEFMIKNGTMLFKYTGNGGDVVIPDGVTEIMGYAFSNARGAKVTSVTIPGSVTKIDNHAFEGCSGLTSVDISYGVATIGYDAFKNCSSLTTITIPDSVTEIGTCAFEHCSSLTSVTIPPRVTEISNSMFYMCDSLASVTIPSSVTKINEFAFYWCKSLTSVDIPYGVKEIDTDAFFECSSLASVTIPSSITKIGKNVFAGCYSLTSITIPSSVTEIGSGTFDRCAYMTDIYYGGTQKQWEDYNFHSNYTYLDSEYIPTIHYNSTGPDAPTEPTPVPSQSESAMPTNDQLTVNGAVQNPTVYKIGGSNFFKIRDLAAMLNGSEKQFDVGYDNALKSVTLTTGKGYTKLDTDLAGAATGGSQTATPSNDSIYIDGQKIDVTVYKIGGNNFFKLRDLGQALDFYVGWSREDGVFIDTSKPYSE